MTGAELQPHCLSEATGSGNPKGKHFCQNIDLGFWLLRWRRVILAEEVMVKSSWKGAELRICLTIRGPCWAFIVTSGGWEDNTGLWHIFIWGTKITFDRKVFRFSSAISVMPHVLGLHQHCLTWLGKTVGIIYSQVYLSVVTSPNVTRSQNWQHSGPKWGKRIWK